MILKNLEKARREAAENPVSGGAYHAWKNIFSATVERMKKPLLALGVTGALLAGLTGCVGSVGPDNTPGPVDPTDPAQTVACSTEDPGPWGDVIADEEVTDEYGAYCRTTIDPKSEALVYDKSKVDVKSLEKYGYTEEDAKEAQQSAVKFLTEETLDSTRLDNYKQSDVDWYKENKGLFNSGANDYLEPGIKDLGLADSGVLVTKYIPEAISRDGGPRANSVSVRIDSIMAAESSTAGGSVLIVKTSATVTYNTTSENIVKTIIKNDSKQTEASLKKSNPELFDGSNATELILTGGFNYGFDKGNTKQPSGLASTWEINTGSGTEIGQVE